MKLPRLQRLAEDMSKVKPENKTAAELAIKLVRAFNADSRSKRMGAHARAAGKNHGEPYNYQEVGFFLTGPAGRTALAGGRTESSFFISVEPSGEGGDEYDSNSDSTTSFTWNAGHGMIHDDEEIPLSVTRAVDIMYEELDSYLENYGGGGHTRGYFDL